jgi:two-component system response regulator RegX3
MVNAKVLLVSDGPGMRDSWVHALRQQGVEVTLAGSAGDAMDRWTEGTFDLVAIDVCTSQLDGIGLCRRLRAEALNPILLLIPTSGESSVLEAYQVGVDECIVKPIGPALFLAKASAWLRHSWTVPTEALDRLQIGDVAVDPARREVVIATGSAVRLTNLEFSLLHFLIGHRGQVLRPGVIVDHVWGYAGSGDNTALKNVIYRLRRKIEPDPANPRYIQTVAGEGYLFQPR